MKQLVMANQSVDTEEVPDPTPKDDWVVVKIIASPICGSDRHVFYAKTPSRGGHEGSGEVVAVDKPERLRVGDRVSLGPLAACKKCEFCNAGDYIHCLNQPPVGTHFAEYTLAQEFVTPTIPDDLDLDVASLAGCALGPSLGALTRMATGPGHTILITGLGPVGLGAVTVAKFRGARVIAVEPGPWRRRRAQELGADTVIDPTEVDPLKTIIDLTEGLGPHHAIDCTGKTPAERLCIDVVRRRGKVAFVGENPDDIPLGPSRDMIRKGIDLIGGWHFNLGLYPEMFRLLRESPVVDKLISHRFGFDQAQEAFDTFFSGQAAKVLIKPWETEA
ncbi:MAG: zinc-binding dehydrogenase [Phycisphaerae bacterium]|nr:zinc-binding dehydrogenase [Phycisphaerae bacterium]